MSSYVNGADFSTLAMILLLGVVVIAWCTIRISQLMERVRMLELHWEAGLYKKEEHAREITRAVVTHLRQDALGATSPFPVTLEQVDRLRREAEAIMNPAYGPDSAFLWVRERIPKGAHVTIRAGGGLWVCNLLEETSVGQAQEDLREGDFAVVNLTKCTVRKLESDQP